MNPLNRQLFYTRLRRQMKSYMPKEKAEKIWQEAGEEYARILSGNPQLKNHNGAMALPAVSLYRALERNNEDAETILNRYGEQMGKLFARIINTLTRIPKVDRFIWNHVESIMDKMSSTEYGYQRRIVSDPPEMYGVDILSCPYHELAKQLGEERAVLCICHMDKEYSRGFHHIRYERYSAVSEGAEACQYRLRFDPEKE